MSTCQEGIVKILEKTAYNVQDWNLFDDWLDIVEASLLEFPNHVRSAYATGQPAEDSLETKELWERLQSRYKPDQFYNFSKAYNMLLEGVAEGWNDILGAVYMLFANPRGWGGQYFTPINVALMMAEMVKDPSDIIMDRLRDARRSVLDSGDIIQIAYLEAATLTGMLSDDNSQAHFLEHIYPILSSYIKPIKIYDPACGSGVMLLASASRFPRWANELGLVQYYGQDIDLTCVKMARCNMMLYGLNGYALKVYSAMMDGQILGMVKSHPPQKAIQSALLTQLSFDFMSVTSEA